MGDFFKFLVDLGERIRDFVTPWTVLAEYERGVLLRLGRHRIDRKWFCTKANPQGVVGPGLLWHLPFNIDEVTYTNVVFETGSHEMQIQSADGVQVNVEIVAGYSISNPRKFLLEIEEAGDAVLDAIGGGAYDVMRKMTWVEMNADGASDKVFRGIARRGVKFGVRMEAVYFHSLVRLGLREGVFKNVATVS